MHHHRHAPTMKTTESIPVKPSEMAQFATERVENAHKAACSGKTPWVSA
jgi:hypothetical protein